MTEIEMFLALTEEQAYESQRKAAVDCGMFAPPGKFGKYVPLKDSRALAVEAATQACCVRSVELATAESTWFVLQLTASVEQMMQSVIDAEISRDAPRSGWRWEGDMPLAAFSKDWCKCVIAPIGAAGWAARARWLQARPLAFCNRCAQCGAEGVEVWASTTSESDCCADCWHSFALEANNSAEAEVPQAQLRCIKGCGRAAALGYNTCCRTCQWSGGGGQHGPKCEEAFQKAQLGEVAMDCA